MGRTAQDYLNVMRSWIGWSEGNGKYRQIIDLYNSHKPLARGYAVQYSDQWCDTTVSAAAIKVGMVDLIGTECGCEEHVKIFKQKGIWIEDGTITPKPGYIILYNWDKASQPNDGYADHIGVVETVSGGMITLIEGNRNDAVSRRYIPVGWGYIRGYAAPRYEGETTEPAPVPEKKPLAKDRTKRLFVGRVTADSLNVRTWAGTEYPNIKSWPVLGRDNLVDVMNFTQKDANGNDWYYVRIDGRIYGFVYAEYVERQ